MQAGLHDAFRDCVTSVVALHVTQHARWCVQARLPEIEELQKQITASCEELAELDFRAAEERAAAAAREAALKVVC